MMSRNGYGQDGRLARYGSILLLVSVAFLLLGHSRVNASNQVSVDNRARFIVDGVRGRMFVVNKGRPNRVVTISTQTGDVIDTLFTLDAGTPWGAAYIAFDHQRNWLLIDELTRVTLLNAETGDIIYQLEDTYNEGDQYISVPPHIDSDLGVAWLFRAGFVDDLDYNSQPSRVIAMDLLNGEHLQERHQAIMYGDGQISNFMDSYYDPVTRRIHYTYWTISNKNAPSGWTKQQHIVTLDAISLTEVSRATIPYSDGDTYTQHEGRRAYWGVAYGGRLHGISSGNHQNSSIPTISWGWDGWTMTSNANEPATQGSEARGIVADIGRGLIVEADDMNFFVREGNSRKLLNTFDTAAFMQEDAGNYFRLVGHDPITDNLVFVVWSYGAQEIVLRPMADLLAQPESAPQHPPAAECHIPPSGAWPPCATGGGDNTPAPPPANDNDCVIPPSGPWPPCATDRSGSPANSDECVIPESGAWPPCATGGY